MNNQDIKSALRSTLNIDRIPETGAFEILSVEDKGDYERSLISYRGYEHDVITAYFLSPKGEGPFPGILVHHQHNSEWHLGKSEVCGLAGDPLNAFGAALAARGFIVLAPDSVGFEDRRRQQKGIEKDEATDWSQYFNGMSYRLLQGRCLMTTILCDAMIGIDVLANARAIDPTRIGTMGHSYGGNTSIFHAAVDERVKYICASGAACSYRNKIENETGIEISLIIPGLLKDFDIPDLIYSILPRKLLLTSASEDIYSKDATEIISSVYERLHDPKDAMNLEHKRYEGKHALTQERFEFIVNWVEKQGKHPQAKNDGCCIG
jgi:dienelactone hydrolase